MRTVLGKPPIWPVMIVLMMVGCSPDRAETTTSTQAPAETTLTSMTATSLAATTVPETTTTSTPPGATGDLLVIGDWGSGTLPQGAVAGAMLRYAEDNDVAAILTTGDNFYSDDAEFLMEPYGWATEQGIPFWITWGNHDVETAPRVEVVEETFDTPPRWTVYEWGAVDIVILDSTQTGSSEQEDFLTESILSSDDPTIVVSHHPPYSCGGHGDSVNVQEQWLDDLDEDVFLVLSGHEHNYQRFEQPTVTYVVTGGGGAALTELAECTSGGPGLIAGESMHHFLVLENTGDSVTVKAVDVNGGIFDEVSLGLP